MARRHTPPRAWVFFFRLPAPRARQVRLAHANPGPARRGLVTFFQAPAAPSPVRHVGTTSELVVYIETRTPSDSDGWTALEGQALMVAEAANLLRLPGRARDQKQ